MKQRITKTTVDNAKAKDGKDLFVWDDLLAGFCLRVYPTGRKMYLCRYRVNRKICYYQIGQHGRISPHQARQKAKEVLDAVARGLDPSGRARGAVKTVADLCTLFMEAHAPSHKDRTSEEYQRWIKLYIVPKLGPLPLAEVKHTDIADFHRSLRDKPTTANRCLAVLSSMFSWADTVGHRNGDNPCRKVKRFKERSKERFLTDSERQRLFDVLDEHHDAEPFVVSAIRLLAYTGCRKNEILTLKWDHVDFENRCLWLPDTKTGKRKVILNAPALAALSGIRRDPANPYVVQGKGGKGHLVGLQRPWDRIRRKAGIPDVRLHDLRHDHVSVGIAAGRSLEEMGKLVGHKSIATTQKYAHLADDHIRAVSEDVGQAYPMPGGKKG